MQKKHGLFLKLIVISSGILCSCSGNPTPSLQPTLISSQTHILLLSPSPKATTATNLPPTPTDIPPTPTNSQRETQIIEKCITPTEGETLTGQGTLVVSGYIKNSLTLWNLDTGNRIFLSEVYSGAAVYQKQIAFIDQTSHQLIIADFDGIKQVLTSTPPSWISTIAWMNQGVILIENAVLIPNGGIRLPSSLISYDLAEKSYDEYFSNYPDIDIVLGPSDFGLGTFSHTSAVYDPTQTRVIYVAARNDITSEYMVLWDIPNKRELMRVWHGYPWSFSSRS